MSCSQKKVETVASYCSAHFREGYMEILRGTKSSSWMLPGPDHLTPLCCHTVGIQLVCMF